MPNVFDFNPTSINPFPYWKWNKVLPAVYDDSLSQYEILCKLLDTVNNIITSTNSTGEQVEQLTQLVQQLIDGGFPSGIVQYVTDIANAAIDDDIATINSRIAALEAQVNSYNQSLQGQINSLNTSLTNQINTVNTNLTALENEIAVAAIRKEGILLLGDSYAQGEHSESATSHNGPNWMDYMESVMGLTNVYKYKGGSAGFYATSTSTSGSSSPVPTGTNYQSILLYAYNYLDGLGKADEIKHIIIQGGVNDGSAIKNGVQISAVESAINSCLTALHSWFPNAKIHIVYACCGYTDWQIDGVRSFEIPRIYKKAAINAGASYNQFTNAPWIFASDVATHDGSHPTAAIQRILGGFMGNVLLNGHADDLTAVANMDGVITQVTSDHRLINRPYQTYISVNATWNNSYQTIVQANYRRRGGLSNMIIPGIGHVATGGEYVMQFGWMADGSIQWRSRGDAASDANLIRVFLPPLEFQIG